MKSGIYYWKSYMCQYSPYVSGIMEKLKSQKLTLLEAHKGDNIVKP